MSADLWAAFGDEPTTTQENPWNESSGHIHGQGPSSQPSLSSSHVISPVAHPVVNEPLSLLTSFGGQQLSIRGVAQQAAAPQSGVSAAQETNASEDDWSAFESATSPPPAPQQQQQQQQPVRHQSENDDEWSAFETAEKPTPLASGQENTFNDAGVMWDADEAFDIASPSKSQIGPDARAMMDAGHSASLIDVSGLSLGDQNEDEDDEFGDFEQAEEPQQSTVSAPSPSTQPVFSPSSQTRRSVQSAIIQNRIETRGAGADRLIFGATQRKAPTVSQHQSPISEHSSPVRPTRVRTISAADKLKPLPPPPPQPTPPVEKDENEFFEDWDDIITSPADTSPAVNVLPLIPVPDSNPSTNVSIGAAAVGNTTPSALPPSNVPPPSILLSHLSTTGLPAFFAPSCSTSPNPTLRTAAHILAGRKQRWKRDTHLAQSMSISAAGPGLKSGMKLAGVDKAEAAREDRDAAEVMRVFKSKAGALRAAASRAGEKGAVELREGAVVRVEKGNGGGTNAATGKPCVICGLRRVERVNGVDVDVYDGFGEWWIEHWGHKECKEWWEREETALRGR